ncbi:hypothetical protein CFP66_08590 [Pseudonocardia sp. MH-G8]|nr:hypothetical protein CFP66_08590 [Pseudonocardia sp. MH-G8]
MRLVPITHLIRPTRTPPTSDDAHARLGPIKGRDPSEKHTTNSATAPRYDSGRSTACASSDPHTSDLVTLIDAGRTSALT